MTRQELAAFIRSHVQSPLSDDQLVDDYLKVHPAVTTDSGDSTVGTIFKNAVPFTIRLLPAVAGGVVGSAAGPLGTAAGGAAGAALGEGGAQLYEYMTGQRKDFSPGQVAAQGAIGAIPIGKAGTVLGAVGKGAALGAGSSFIDDIIGKGERPDPLKAVVSGAAGAAFGAAGHAVGSKLTSVFQRMAPVESQEAAKVAEQISQSADPQATIEEVKKGLRFVQPTPYFDAPGERPRSPSELQSFKSIKYMPEDVRPQFIELLDESNQQRRGVQPIAMSEAKATHKFVPLTTLKPGSTMNVEDVIAHNEAWTNIGQQIQELSKKIADGTGTNADRLMLAQRLEEHKVIGLNYVGAVSEAARVLRGLQRPVRSLAVADSEFIEQVLKSPKFKDDLDKAAKIITAAGSDPEKQLRALLEARGRTKTGQIQAYLYNSILSGVKTPLRKTIADVMNMVSNFATHPFAVGADIARHAISGAPREVFLGEMPHQVYGVLHALPQAYKEFVFTFGNGYSLKGVEKFVEMGEQAVQNMPEDLPGGMVTNYPLRSLKAVTAFFHELAYGQELWGRAYAKAVASGAKGVGPIREKMVSLVTGSGDLSKELQDGASAFAKRATFMDPSGSVLQAFLKIKADAPKPLQPLLTFIAPVVRLPGKVLQRGLETSPIGFGMKGGTEAPALANLIKGTGGREGAQQIGRATMGSVALAPFMMLAASGRLTGMAPADPKLREEFFDSGKRPNAVKVGNEWVTFHLAQPFATEMSIAASAFDRFVNGKQTDEEAASIWEDAGRALAAGANTVFDQSYFANLSSFLQAMQDPGRYGQKFARGVAQDVVPYGGLLRNITQAVDPTVRNPEGVSEDIKSIIPGMSESVPARLDRFGFPTQRPGNAVMRGFVPVEASPEVSDPVQEMLDSVGKHLGRPTVRLTEKGKPINLSRDDKYAVQQAIGLEHRAALEQLQRRGKVTDKMVTDALNKATREVDDKAKRLLKRGEPLTTDKLTRKQVDEMYQRYLDAIGERE